MKVTSYCSYTHNLAVHMSHLHMYTWYFTHELLKMLNVTDQFETVSPGCCATILYRLDLDTFCLAYIVWCSQLTLGLDCKCKVHIDQGSGDPCITCMECNYG